MRSNNTLTQLFIKKSKLMADHSSKWHLLVELSFEANAQVCYKDEHAHLKIKRFKTNRWEATFWKSKANISPVELKVFVCTPNLLRDEEIKLAISQDNELIEEKVFCIAMDNEHAGWFGLSHIPEI